MAFFGLRFQFVYFVHCIGQFLIFMIYLFFGILKIHLQFFERKIFWIKVLFQLFAIAFEILKLAFPFSIVYFDEVVVASCLVCHLLLHFFDLFVVFFVVVTYLATENFVLLFEIVNVLSVLGNFKFGYVFPFLKELQVVFLSLLLYLLVVFIHVFHQLHLPFMKDVHVLLNFLNMHLNKFSRVEHWRLVITSRVDLILWWMILPYAFTIIFIIYRVNVSGPTWYACWKYWSITMKVWK